MTFFRFFKDLFSFRNISIKRKLILIILLTSWATLLVASIAFVAMDVITYRQAMVNDISSLAQVVGFNSSGALVFNDQRTAENLFMQFRKSRHCRQVADGLMVRVVVFCFLHTGTVATACEQNQWQQ